MKILHTLSNRTLYISLSGDLDESSASAARGGIDALLERGGFTEVVFDFSEVGFMDSTGIGIVLGRYKKLNKANVEMFIRNPKPNVDKVFSTSGIYEIIHKTER